MKFIDAAATSHNLSLAAMEEASRFGQRTAEVDHMLLALVVNEQPAGQVLRSLGITIDSARAAVEAQHAEQLESLGIRAGGSAQGPIVFHETGGYRWGEGPLEIIKRAGAGEQRGDAAAVLRELVAEPSGLVEAVLQRLGTSPDEVIGRLDEVERHSALLAAERRESADRQGPGEHRGSGEPRTGAGAPAADALSGTSESFAPAPIDAVWRLLADPARMPEWEPGIGAVEFDEGDEGDEAASGSGAVPDTASGSGAASAAVPAGWLAIARTERADGKPIRVRPEYRVMRVEMTERREGSLAEWRFTFPEAPRANAKRVRIELEPAAGGTQLRIALAWERSAIRRPGPLRGLLLRPLHRFAIWMQLMQLGAAIGRVFR